MLGATPYASLKFGIYEFAKTAICRMRGVDEKELPGQFRVVSGSVAGMVAMTICYPFDVVRRRMQVIVISNTAPMIPHLLI